MKFSIFFSSNRTVCCKVEANSKKEAIQKLLERTTDYEISHIICTPLYESNVPDLDSLFGSVAQSAEHETLNLGVEGSTPSASTMTEVQMTKDTLPGYSGQIDSDNVLHVKTPLGSVDHLVLISDLPAFYVEACSIIADLAKQLAETRERSHL